MSILLAFTTILQSVAIGLGVGTSTLAIINFFVAIADGKIEPEERKMMGVVYIVLRVAMGLILLTTVLLTLFGYYHFTLGVVSGYGLAFWLLILVLYSNAVLMTYHLMPSTIGPALQASTWYTLGTLSALLPLGWVHFSVFHFTLAYVSFVLLAIAAVNGVLAYLTHRRTQS